MIGRLGLFLGLCVALSSCYNEFNSEQTNENSLSVKVDLATRSTDVVENELNDVSAYLFSEGKLKGRLNDLKLIDGEVSSLQINYNDGDNLYFVSQNNQVITSVPEDESEFCSVMGRTFDTSSVPVFVSGGVSLHKNAPNLVKLIRGVARIDVETIGDGLSVKKVQLADIASQGLLFTQEAGVVNTQESICSITSDFSTQPVSGLTSGVFYVYEQKCTQERRAKAIIEYMLNNEVRTAEVELPEVLKRNNIYKLSLVRAEEVTLSVDIAQWGMGTDTDLSPDLTQKILINMDASQIPSDARITESADTLFFSSLGGTATLNFNSLAEVECISTSVTDVEVTKSSELGVNTFLIKGNPRASGQSVGYVDLLMRQKGMITTVNRITVVIPANSIQFFNDAGLTQSVAFVNNAMDFGKYVDGTLGYLVVPEGISVKVNGVWIRLDKAEDIIKNGSDVYRVEGGFKPNDPEADGRMQEANVMIGSDTYTFKRLNWGLPVVKINGVYWCKYNIIGNAKKFEDQISIRCDRDSVKSVETFLKSYSIEHPTYPGRDIYIPNSVKSMKLFYRMLGQGYQSGNVNGMLFKASLGTRTDYSYVGYNSYYPEQETGLLPADSLAPDGYKVADKSDFLKLVPNENFNLGNFGTTSSYNVNGVNMNVEIYTIPTMAFNTNQFFGLEGEDFTGNFEIGSVYGKTYCYLFKEAGMTEPLVLLGHPYQFKKPDGGSQTVYKSCEIMFVSHDSVGKAWLIDAHDDNAPVYIKTVSEGIANYPKIIRCVKKPVNYIIE